MFRFLFLCSALLLLSCPAHAETVFNAKHFTLENGMDVVLIENHRVPIITHMIWYKVGAADEPSGQSGIAHFLEHLMFKGSGDLKPGEFSKTISALGGRDNAFTSQDYTAYFQMIAAEHLETVMKMEAGRMNGLKPPLSEVESEHKVVIEERRQNIENNPRRHFFETMQAALFPNHPYGTPVIGWMSEMQAMTWEQAYAFYDKWYAPNNAILVVSGDVTLEELKPLAEKIYGVLPRENVPVRKRNIIPPLKGEIKLTFESEDIHQRTITRMYRVPSHRTENRTDSLALELLTEILGGDSTTRLYKKLVVEDAKAATIQLSYDPASYDDSTLWLHATPLDNVSAEELEAAIDEILTDFIKKGPTEQELTEAQNRMENAAIFARDSVTGPAMAFGYTLATGGTIDDVEYWPDQIKLITTEQIQNVAERFLDPAQKGDGHMVTGYMFPKTTTNHKNSKNREAQ